MRRNGGHTEANSSMYKTNFQGPGEGGWDAGQWLASGGHKDMED
jgi:hypothetical protein